jgi:hypothetical protein
MKSPGQLGDRGFKDGRRVSPLLSVRSKLFQREQVNHSPVFNASLAQSHNVSSHTRHQFMVRLNTKGFARVRERCGHNSDLFRLKCSSR